MFLVLDFTRSLRLAILKKNILIHKELKTKKNVSEILITEIEKFLKESNTSINKLKSIYIITGPGSFTGIRSALTFAKSIRLIVKLRIFGISKFEIINFKSNISNTNNEKCIFLHFKDNQFFTQSFKGYKAINEVRIINFGNEKFEYNSSTSYIYDNMLLETLINGSNFQKIKENFHLVEYNLDNFYEIILKKIIDNSDPKPLYINNHY